VLQREGLSYRPDLVVGSFYVGNDVDFGYVDPHPLYKESLRIYHVAMRLAEIWRESRRKGSTLREALAGEAGTGDVAAAAEVFQFSHERYVRQQRRHLRLCRRERNADDEREWRFSLDAVARIAKLCQERGIPFVLVVSPDAYQTDPDVLEMALAGLPDDGRYPPWSADDFDLDAPQHRIAHFAEQRAIALLDLLPAFAAARARGEGPFFLERNNHWNAAGNRVAALALARFLAPKLAGLAPAGGGAH
jgi:hypothetical protein